MNQILTAKGIREADVGGALSVKLSAPKYFVIHDTSDLLTSKALHKKYSNKLPKRLTKRAVLTQRRKGAKKNP